jgi:hypothetical protein
MREGGAGLVGVAVGDGQFALLQAHAFLEKQKEDSGAAKAYRGASTTDDGSL